MLPKFFRFKDLQSSGLVDSWSQLKEMQAKYGFPSGRLLSPNVRAWTDDEITAWLASRPTERVMALRGGAQKKVEQKVARQRTEQQIAS